MKIQLLIALTATLFGSALRAEEGGGGHYMPGATASFIDALPGRPSIAAVNLFTYYGAKADASRPLPLNGLLTAGIDATVYADTVALVYESPLRLLGGNYAGGIAVPFVWMEIKGQAQRIGPRGVLGPVYTARDTASGVGDITLFPFMLGWTNGTDFKYDVRLGVYAPSGEYEAGRLANVGKNYWTFEPGASVSWLSSKIGTEVSLFAGFDLSTKNKATDYQSGEVFHLDGTIAQHLPLFGGFIGVGANGFYYQQISGDSGSGAQLGGFEGRTAGIGPVLSYARKLGQKTDLVAEVKWLPELDVTHRLKGDYIWFKLALVF
jgi:hypothetical protein